MTQASGSLYHRGGNGNGWSGTWRTILDSTNYTDFAASKNHTHNYAGSSSAGGSANSVANSLSIQLNGGTATTFNGSAAKSINITPSAIGAAASSHTHSYLPLSGGNLTGNVKVTSASGDIKYEVANSNSGKSVALMIGSSGINRGIYDVSGNKWMVYADANNTIQLNGNASTASKLSTARTISAKSDSLMSFSVDFDGSANVNSYLNPKSTTLSVGNKNNYPWHRIATYDATGPWDDAMATLFLTGGYNGAPYGIVRVVSRIDSAYNTASNTVTVNWLLRSGYDEGDIYACTYIGKDRMYVDVFLKSRGSYESQNIQLLAGGGEVSLLQDIP